MSDENASPSVDEKEKKRKIELVSFSDVIKY